MATLRRRVEALEVKNAVACEQSPGMALQLHCKMVERARARTHGQEVPRYTPKELEAMRAYDEESAAGEGAVGELRGSTGWQSEECQQRLDEWRESARRRLRLVEAGVPLSTIYEDDDEPTERNGE